MVRSIVAVLDGFDRDQLDVAEARVKNLIKFYVSRLFYPFVTQHLRKILTVIKSCDYFLLVTCYFVHVRMHMTTFTHA